MYEVYVPFENVDDYIFYSYDSTGNLIYAFKSEPIENDYNNVDIIYINNHYNVVNSNVIVNDLNFIQKENITNNWFYRKDLSDVMICFFFMILFFFCIPLFLISRIFKRRW